MSIKEILSKAAIKTKDGKDYDFQSVEDTIHGLYFSAHWYHI
jgi:hypothetical protein